MAMQRRWFRFGLYALAALLLLLGAVLWIFSSILLYTRPLVCTKKHFVYCGTPAEQKLAFSQVSFRSRDGLLLKGWWLPAPRVAKGASKAIVFSHGRGGDKREGMRYARVLHQAGFHVLAFDYRNSGQSEGHFNSMGFHERKDLVAAIDFVATAKGVSRIGVFGFSLGAATAINVTASDRRVLALVAEGGFAHVTDVVAERGRMLFGLPRYPLVPLVMMLYRMRGHLDERLVHPEEHIAKISPRPVFLIHGTADRVVLPSHGKRLFAAARQPKTLWVVPGGRHVETWQRKRSEAERRVVRFFQRYVGKSQGVMGKIPTRR